MEELQKLATDFNKGVGVGALVGIFLGAYIKGKITQHFKRSDTHYDYKRSLATQIIEIIAEGEGSGYQKNARDKEYIISLANKAGIYSVKLEELIKKYQVAWWPAADAFNRNPRLLPNYRSLEGELSKFSFEIKSLVNKWLR